MSSIDLNEESKSLLIDNNTATSNAAFTPMKIPNLENEKDNDDEESDDSLDEEFGLYNFSPIKPNSPSSSLNQTTMYQSATSNVQPQQQPNTNYAIQINQHQSTTAEQSVASVGEESDGELDLNDLPETVSVLKAPGDKTVYLVGTSHFSKQSHRDVRRVIRTVRPRVVILELCPSRICFLTMNEKEIMSEARSLDFTKIMDYIKKNGVVQGFIYTLLLSASAKITNDLDMAPGGEFRNAFNEALKIPNCSVLLGDRPVNITLRRAIATLSTWQRIKMTYNCLFSNEKLSEEELEKYKQKDILEQLIDELTLEFPGLSRVMVEERDAFLAYSLWSACNSTEPGSTLVGVVGIGHAAGIKNNWDNADKIDVQQLARIPESKSSKTFLVIKYSFYGLLAYGVYRYAVPNVVKNGIRYVASAASDKITDIVQRYN